MKLYRLILLSIVVCLAACRKDIDDIEETPGNNPPKTFVNGSVFGKISDEDGNPIEGATIEYDAATVLTDEFGNFQLLDQSLVEQASSIKVFKEGYFKSSRTIYPRLNEMNHMSLTLMERVSAGTISPGVTSTVSAEGIDIEFKNPAFVTSTGEAFETDVAVFVRWLDPTAENLVDIMPGDLIGVDADNNINALQSFGMIGVELSNAAGEEIQLAEGSEAEISLSVPASMQATAPASIPLWHFNEDEGVWEEEGEAVLDGGKYVGTVRHFSFWNCDAPFPLITLSGTIAGENGGVEGIKVRITDLELDQSACGLTSNRGFFTGKVPQGHELLLEIISPCGNIIHAEEIGSFEEDTEYGTIVISSPSDVEISGSLTNCNDDDITQGYVHIEFENGGSLSISVEDDQTFATTLMGCDNGQLAEAVGIDVTNNLISAVTEFNMTGEVNLILEACDEYYEPGIFVEYNNGFEFQSSAQDTVAHNYSIEDFGTFKNYHITVLDWLTGNVLMEGTVTVVDGETNVQYSLGFTSDGFTVDGTTTGGIIDQGFEILHLSDITQNITVDDTALYDPTITEVTFTINLEL